jgi:hypothetical protein
VLALGPDSPSDPCRLLLKGMKHASSEEFQGTCSSQLGILDTVMYKSWKRVECPTMEMELDVLGDTLKERFVALSQNKEWTGASHKVGTFKTELAQKAEVTGSNGKGRLPWTEWWDSQVCKVKHCGGKHPTSYHNNLEARDRPQPSPNPNRARSFRKPTGNRQPGKQNQQTPRFKNKESEQSFRKKVYNVVLESFVDEDHDLFAHLAGAAEDDTAGFESAVEEEEVEEVDTEVMANAAISLDQLLNW